MAIALNKEASLVKTTQITQNSYQLTRFGLVNCYLVHEADGLTLIDAGVLASSADQILDAAKNLTATLRRIVLTHAHSDHVGSVDAIMAKSPAGAVELISNSRSLPLLRKPADVSLRPSEPLGKIKGGLPGIAAKPTRLLNENDMVGSLRCIDTPGHIPGHMSFLDERDGTLFAGDALVAVGELNVTNHAPWFFPFPRLVTWNADVAIASAEKLLNYPIARFACGHGPVRRGGLPALQHALDKAKP